VIRNGRRRLAFGSLVGIGLLSLAPAAGAQGLYQFIDERGVVHFTNVQPSDPRYQRQVITPRGIHPGRDLNAQPPIHHGYDALIMRAARAYQVQPGLVKAVIAAESKFDASAISRKGALGLMQLMPSTARSLGVEEPFEPVDNILGGVRYLRSMLTRYGDVSRALAAYNAGPDAVDYYGGIPPYDETRAYVTRVLDYYRRYDRDFRR
jgi:soluble lytic murein transglycosylase